MTRQYLGNGRWQSFRDDELTCIWMRHGVAHPAHEYRYARTDAVTGDIVIGGYYCDGVTESESGNPFPMPPLDAVEKGKAAELLVGLWNSLPHDHPDKPGVWRAVEVLRAAPDTEHGSDTLAPVSGS